MKKSILFTICLFVSACSMEPGPTGATGSQGPRGSQGTQGAPGKSAYEIWLDAGNTGTEQDFLDSLVANNNNNSTPDWYTSTHEYFDSLENSYIVSTTEQVNWPGHNTYWRYAYESPAIPYSTIGSMKYIISEKEQTLGNYGVYVTQYGDSFGGPYIINQHSAYIHNREGDGVNAYTPVSGVVFNGGTLAYLYHDSVRADDVFIKGDSQLTYDPTNPVLRLDFDNYYNLTFARRNDGKYTVTIAGTNNTGDASYNLPTGNFTNKNVTTQSGYASKGATQEAFGTYNTTFNDSAYGNTGTITESFSINGAFGGEKQ